MVAENPLGNVRKEPVLVVNHSRRGLLNEVSPKSWWHVVFLKYLVLTLRESSDDVDHPLLVWNVPLLLCGAQDTSSLLDVVVYLLKEYFLVGRMWDFPEENV